VHIVPELAVPARWQDHANAAVRQAVEQEQRELEEIIPTFASRAPATLIVKAGPVPEGLAEAVTPSDTRRPVLVLGRRNTTSRLGAPGTTAYRVLTRTQVPVLLYLPGR